MRISAIQREGTSPVLQKTVVPPALQGDERDTALEFSAVIIPFSVGELSQAARRTKEAAKKWKQGRSMPSAWSLLKMANDIPEVRSWVMSKLGIGRSDLSPEDQLRLLTPEALQTVMAAAYQVAHEKSPSGDAVRRQFGDPRGRNS